MSECVMVSWRRRLNGNIMLRDQPDWATNPQVQLIDFEYSDFNLRAFDIGTHTFVAFAQLRSLKFVAEAVSEA